MHGPETPSGGFHPTRDKRLWRVALLLDPRVVKMVVVGWFDPDKSRICRPKLSYPEVERMRQKMVDPEMRREFEKNYISFRNCARCFRLLNSKLTRCVHHHSRDPRDVKQCSAILVFRVDESMVIIPGLNFTPLGEPIPVIQRWSQVPILEREPAAAGPAAAARDVREPEGPVHLQPQTKMKTVPRVSPPSSRASQDARGDTLSAKLEAARASAERAMVARQPGRRGEQARARLRDRDELARWAAQLLPPPRELQHTWSVSSILTGLHRTRGDEGNAVEVLDGLWWWCGYH